MIYLSVQLLQSTSIDQLRNITWEIKNFIANNDQIAQSPDATQYVCVESINYKSIDIVTYCFTKSTLYSEFVNVREGLLLEIKRLVEESGAQFAHEIRTLYIGNAEAFTTGANALEG